MSTDSTDSTEPLRPMFIFDFLVTTAIAIWFNDIIFEIRSELLPNMLLADEVTLWSMTGLIGVLCAFGGVIYIATQAIGA